MIVNDFYFQRSQFDYERHHIENREIFNKISPWQRILATQYCEEQQVSAQNWWKSSIRITTSPLK